MGPRGAVLARQVGQSGAGEVARGTVPSETVGRRAGTNFPEAPLPRSVGPAPPATTAENETIAATATGGVLLVIVTGSAIALARQGGHRRGPVARPPATRGPGAQAGTSRPGDTAASAPSGGGGHGRDGPAARGFTHPPRPRPGHLPGQPDPEVPSGRAAFDNTRSGTVTNAA